MSYADFIDYRDQSGVFSDLAGYELNFAGLSADARADRIAVAYVTGNFFSMLGVGASPGRPVLPSEGATFGADPIVVLVNLLFGVSATDAATFTAVPLLLGLMALLASYLPALRATRIAPSVALRNE